MNPKLIKDITDRVRQVKAAKEDESILSAHLDAIADVYGTDRATVESIARNVIAEGSAPPRKMDFAKVRNILWISALVLIIISVIWLLFNNLQTSKKADSNGLSKDDMRKVEYVKEALVSLNVMKVYVSEHVATVGTTPTSFSEIGVKESDFVISKYIDRIQMKEDGTVAVTLSHQLIGDERFITLKPLIQKSTYKVEWDCRSNLKLEILDEIKDCTKT